MSPIDRDTNIKWFGYTGYLHSIAEADTGVIDLAGTEQRAVLFRRQDPALRETTAAQVTDHPDGLEAFHIH